MLLNLHSDHPLQCINLLSTGHVFLRAPLVLLLNFFELSAIRLQHLPLVIEFAFVIVPLGLYVLQLFLH